MVGKGRPYIGERYELRLPPDLAAKLDARAAAEGITRAELLRRYAQEGVERDEGNSRARAELLRRIAAEAMEEET